MVATQTPPTHATHVCYGREYIIINKYDVILMTSFNLYNPYSEDKFNLLDRPKFDKYQRQELKILS